VHVIRICEWGSKRREHKFLTFKVSHILDAFFFSRGERLREEKRTKAGRREGMGGEGDINSAEGLRYCPHKDGHCVILSSHAGWQWI